MGTRGTIRLIKNGKVIVIYNHFDSYPSGLGVRLLKSLSNLIQKYGHTGLIELCDKAKIVDDSILPTEDDKIKLKPYTDLRVGHNSDDSWYCLTRRLQGDFSGILEVGYIYGFDNPDWFEEYNYYIDLDKKIFYLEDESRHIPLEIPEIEKEIKNYEIY